MGEGISDYTKCVIDLRRQMWMAGVEEELRRLIWQIAVTGKYISAKIHESNRKLAGFKNLYGEEQLSLDRSSDEILKNQLQFSGFVREYASEEQDAVVLIGKGREKYYRHGGSAGRLFPRRYQPLHRDYHRHPQGIDLLQGQGFDGGGALHHLRTPYHDGLLRREGGT